MWLIGGFDADPLRLVRSRAGAPAYLPGMETIIPLSGLEPVLSIEVFSEYLNVPIRTLYDCGLDPGSWTRVKEGNL